MQLRQQVRYLANNWCTFTAQRKPSLTTSYYPSSSLCIHHPRIPLFFSLRFRFRTMISNCCTPNNTPRPGITDKKPTTSISSPNQNADELVVEDLSGNFTFTAYPLRQAKWSDLGSSKELADYQPHEKKKTLRNRDFTVSVATPLTQ